MELLIDHTENIFGRLPGDWKMTNLGKIVDSKMAEIQTGPFGTMLHASEYSIIGTPVIAVKNIADNRIITNDIPRIGHAIEERLSKYKLKKGDILFGRKGAVDRRALIGKEQEGWIQGSDCIRIRFLEPNIDPRFVSFVFGSDSYRNWILQNAHGATMPSLNQGIIRRIPLPLPPLPEQKAIARILGSLDDKIELNRRMNKTLEDIARAIFKSWFVDFDPVKAKMEGRTPAGVPEEIIDLFPDKMEESELGLIPEGWEVSTIGAEVQSVGGGTPSTKEPSYWEDGTFCWSTPKDLSKLSSYILLDTERKITKKGLNTISSGLLPTGLLPTGTVLMSSRAPVGYLAVAEVPTAINQGFIAILCDKTLTNHYILHWLNFNMDTIKNNAGGTTFQEISKKNFRPIKLIVPSEKVVKSFSDIIDVLYRRMVVNLKEIETLVVLRDTLLPKLISGKIRVNEAERLVGIAL